LTQVCRRRWPAALLSACSACVVVAGCASGERKVVPAPKLPAPLAQSLAAGSDQVATQLGSGDACGAAATARALQERTIKSIGTVASAFQEPLQSAVNDLADRTSAACMAAQPKQPPPLPPTSQPEPGKGHGHGKGHKKKQGDDEGGGD
jgi:hypothetical protein